MVNSKDQALVTYLRAAFSGYIRFWFFSFPLDETFGFWKEHQPVHYVHRLLQENTFDHGNGVNTSSLIPSMFCKRIRKYSLLTCTDTCNSCFIYTMNQCRGCFAQKIFHSDANCEKIKSNILLCIPL